MNTVIVEGTDMRDARGAVAETRQFCEDLILFDREGNILSSRMRDGERLGGDSIIPYMSASEWEFLRSQSISYACARTVVETKLGMMLVFCNVLAAMHVMMGLIFQEDRATVAYRFGERITMVDMLSPRAKLLAVRSRGKIDLEAADRVEAVAKLAFSAFATASFQGDLARSMLKSTSYIIRRICLAARLIGCRVNCRSIREFPPRTEDFSGPAFVALIIQLLFFVYESCPSRTAEVEIGDFDGRLKIILRCELPDGEREIFVNRQFRYTLLDRCDRLAGYWGFPFECAPYPDGLDMHLRVAFCPKIKVVDGLRVKEPTKKMNYSDPKG